LCSLVFFFFFLFPEHKFLALICMLMLIYHSGLKSFGPRIGTLKYLFAFFLFFYLLCFLIQSLMEEDCLFLFNVFRPDGI
jgi:hypothetical protein